MNEQIHQKKSMKYCYMHCFCFLIKHAKKYRGHNAGSITLSYLCLAVTKSTAKFQIYRRTQTSENKCVRTFI